MERDKQKRRETRDSRANYASSIRIYERSISSFIKLIVYYIWLKSKVYVNACIATLNDIFRMQAVSFLNTTTNGIPAG